MKTDGRLLSLLRSFKYAAAGILHCVRHERNVRLHLCAGAFVILLMRFYSLTNAESCVVYLTIALVIAAEMINTGVEAAVDLITPEKHRLAKIAKDSCSAGVLVLAVFSVVIAYNIFWDVEVFKKIARHFSENKLHLFLIILLFVFSLIFIFKWPNKKDRY